MCPGRKASWDLIVDTCKDCDKLKNCDDGKLFLKLEHKFKWSEVTDLTIKNLCGSNHINI